MKKVSKREQKDALKERVLNARKNFPFRDYIAAYQLTFGNQSGKQISKIRNTWNLRSMDEQIVHNIEIICKSFCIKEKI